MANKNSREDYCQKEEIAQPFEAPFFVMGFTLAHCFRRPEEVASINHEKQAEKNRHASQPHGQAVGQYPPKRHALQITQKERRITNRRKTAADVRHDKNEKYDVV